MLLLKKENSGHGTAPTASDLAAATHAEEIRPGLPHLSIQGQNTALRITLRLR